MVHFEKISITFAVVNILIMSKLLCFDMKKCAILLSVAAVLLVGCIDRDFDIADISGEVTLGGEELVLPLGTIDKITLDKLFAENDVVKPDQNSVYSIMFSSFGDDPTKYERISIDAISIPNITNLSPKIDPISFSLPELPSALRLKEMNEKIVVDYPSIGNAVEVAAINMGQELSLGLPMSGVGTLTEAMLPLVPGVNLSHADEVSFDADITIVDGIKFIDFVEFGCNIHPFGAPIEIGLDLRGVADINGGGTLDVRVEFPTGYYLRYESGEDLPFESHNIISQRVTLDKKQQKAKVLVYLHKIDYGGKELTQGKLEIRDKIRYDVALNLGVTTGTYDMSAMPRISFTSAPEYKDVEVVINHFDIAPVIYPISYSFDGMNNTISVEKVAFKSAPMRLSMSGLEWLDVNVGVRLDFPSCMHFGSVDGAQQLNTEENTLLTTIRDLEHGLTLNLLYIDCTDPSCKQENAQLVLNGEIKTTLDLTMLDGHTVLLSELTPKTNEVKLAIKVDETTLTLDTENSVVKVVGDDAFNFKIDNQIPSLSKEIDIPEQIASIEEVKICKLGSTTGEPVALSFSVSAHNGTFPVGLLNLDIMANLGKLLRPTQATLESGVIKVAENGDYLLAIKELWDTSTTLSKRVEFEAIQNLPEIVDGKMLLRQTFPVTGSVSIASGETVKLHEESAAVNIDITVDDIEITSVTGSLGMEISPETMKVEFGDLSDLGVDIGAMTINPVLKFNVKNPTGVPISAEAQLVACDAEGKTLSTISIPKFDIAGSGETKLVISTPKNEANYNTEGVTFVGVEGLSSLLGNGIPSQIAFDIKAMTDSSKSCTIDLASIKQDGLSIDYQYEVVIPLSFDGDLKISYESSVNGLNEVFAELASYGNSLTVNDIGLMAEFGTNIPFNIVLEAELINKEGTTEGISAKLDIEKGVIEGYTPEYGEKRTSNLIINFNLGEEKSLAALKNVDGLRFKFAIYNADGDTSSLNAQQFLDGKLKLRVREGLSLDIFELLKGEAE